MITLEDGPEDENDKLWYFNVDGGYLYAASNSSNHLKTESSPDANGNASAAIAIESIG